MDQEIAYRVALRFAGQWEPPPAVYKAVAKWAADMYASHVLGLVEDALEGIHKPLMAQRDVDRLKQERDGAGARLRSLKPGKRIRFNGSEGHDDLCVTLRPDGLYVEERGRGSHLYVILTAPSVDKMLVRVTDFFNGAITRAERKAAELAATEEGKSLRNNAYNPKRRIVTLTLLKNECLKYTSKGTKRSKKVEEQIPVDVTGWKYLTAEEVKNAGDLLEEAHFTHIYCVLYFRAQKDEWGGLWEGFSRRLSLNAPEGDSTSVPGLDIFRDRMRSLLGSIWHETQHVGQDLLRSLRSLKEDAGLPSHTIRNEDVTPEGRPIDPKDRRIRKDDRTKHYLRDVEFYTNLGNDTRHLLSLIPKVKDGMRREFFKYFVGDTTESSKHSIHYSARMWKLKEEAPAKWAKAVAELHKAVEEYL